MRLRFQFQISGWHYSARKGPCTLRPLSLELFKNCFRNSSGVWLKTDNVSERVCVVLKGNPLCCLMLRFVNLVTNENCFKPGETGNIIGNAVCIGERVSGSADLSSLIWFCLPCKQLINFECEIKTYELRATHPCCRQEHCCVPDAEADHNCTWISTNLRVFISVCAALGGRLSGGLLYY